MRPGDRLVRSGTSDSFGSALVVIVVVWVRLIRPGVRWVRSGSPCSYGCALRVAGFMRLLRAVAV